MCNSKHKKVLFQAILLLMGYGLFYPNSVCATQRNLNTIDSIAFAAMNRCGILFGAYSNRQIRPELRLRSSQLSDKAARLLGNNEAFYIYGNANGGDGFVIVSADDRMQEVLAYSLNESFNTELPTSTRYWLECYLDDYLGLDSKIPDTEYSCIQSSEIIPEGVSPILGNLPWGQSDPYNGLCPLSSGGRCVVGCVATAMSQVMWLHKWPICGRGNINYTTRTHQIRVKMNLAEHPFQWNLIKEEYNRGKYTDEEANAVATLMAACGAAVHMDYAADGSGAYQEDILRALVSNFNYDPDAAFLPREYFTSADWHNLLITELNEGRAINYAGQSRTDGGHSFVIDGYETGSNSSNPYYHLNWGWNGHCNGYYTLPQLHPAEDGKYYVEEGFSEGQQMLIGVKPDDGQTEANKMLCAQGLRVMQASLKPGEATTLRVNEITNLCYRTFRGIFALQLTGEDGISFVAGKVQTEPISYLESKNSITIPFVIPENFEEGNYTVKVVGINEDGQQTVMYSRSVPQITVSLNPYGEETPSGITLLCSSEFEVFKQAEVDSILNVRVYELFNYSDNLLEGDLQLEIASDDGTSITPIGTSVWHPAFEAQEVESAPISLIGSVPDTLSNGKYRLYVLFYPAGQSLSNRVKFYDRIDPSEVPTEYYLPMSVTDDAIIVNGVSFSKMTNSIYSTLRSPNSPAFVYSLMGVRRNNVRKGMNIVKMSDGTVIKFMSK